MNTEATYLKKRIKEKQIMISILLTVCAILAIFCAWLVFYIFNMINGYASLQNKYNELSAYSESIMSISSDKNNSIKELEGIIKTQDEQIQDLSQINKRYVDELNDFYDREELYDKYEYAIFDETGERTELTYAQIKLGEELMEENGYDPNLMFGTIMVESRGNPTCVNSESGATGLGQFLNSTAEYVWCDLMGNDYYSPEIMKDPESNIKMMACYYDHLYKIKGDTFNVIKTYSGNATDWGTLQYINKINEFTSKVGVIIS